MHIDMMLVPYLQKIGYFENLASKGIAEAQFNIGLCYYNLNNFFIANFFIPLRSVKQN